MEAAVISLMVLVVSVVLYQKLDLGEKFDDYMTTFIVLQLALADICIVAAVVMSLVTSGK